MLECVLFLVCFAHETAGAARTRSSLRPLDFEGKRYPERRAPCSARMRTCVRCLNFDFDTPHVIARSACDEAIHLTTGAAVRWIAARSLSSGAHSRDPVARNDVEAAFTIPSPASPPAYPAVPADAPSQIPAAP